MLFAPVAPISTKSYAFSPNFPTPSTSPNPNSTAVEPAPFKKLPAFLLKLICDSIELRDILTEEKQHELENLIPNNFLDCLNFKYKNFSVGKVAEYDLVLKTKFLHIEEISDSAKKLYRKYLLNAIFAIEIADYICTNLRPKMFLAFNPYTICQCAAFMAKNNNILLI